MVVEVSIISSDGTRWQYTRIVEVLISKTLEVLRISIKFSKLNIFLEMDFWMPISDIIQVTHMSTSLFFSYMWKVGDESNINVWSDTWIPTRHNMQPIILIRATFRIWRFLISSIWLTTLGNTIWLLQSWIHNTIYIC